MADKPKPERIITALDRLAREKTWLDGDFEEQLLPVLRRMAVRQYRISETVVQLMLFAQETHDMALYAGQHHASREVLERVETTRAVLETCKGLWNDVFEGETKFILQDLPEPEEAS